MNVYIATKFEAVEGFSKAKTLLEAAGHRITHDWTTDNVAGLQGEELKAYLTQCAATCVIGIYMSDVLIFLPTKEHMAGSFIELGLAIGMWKRVIIVDAFNPEFQQPIFYNLPEVQDIYHHVKTIEEAVALVKPIEAKVKDVVQAPVSGSN